MKLLHLYNVMQYILYNSIYSISNLRDARAVMHAEIASEQFFPWSLWREKRSRHSRRLRNPQCYVSGNRLIYHSVIWLVALRYCYEWNESCKLLIVIFQAKEISGIFLEINHLTAFLIHLKFYYTPFNITIPPIPWTIWSPVLQYENIVCIYTECSVSI